MIITTREYFKYIHITILWCSWDNSSKLYLFQRSIEILQENSTATIAQDSVVALMCSNCKRNYKMVTDTGFEYVILYGNCGIVIYDTNTSYNQIRKTCFQAMEVNARAKTDVQLHLQYFQIQFKFIIDIY
jgi:hypothetical protein